jgi:hypothetical protein
MYGARMGPPLMVLHVQIQWRSWLLDQVGIDIHQSLYYFCSGLHILEQQKNLAWVPSCANVPQMQALQHVPMPEPANRAPTINRASVATATVRSGGASVGGGGGSAAPGGVATCNGKPSSVRARIHSTSRCREFTGNSPYATNIRTRCVAEAIVLGGNPPSVVRNGEPNIMCVS